MSKKSHYILSHNLLQSHLNNKPTTKAISEISKSQQSLEKQQTKQNIQINIRTKLHKTANISKRCVTPKDKFRCGNCMPNNRRKLTPATRKNVTGTMNFNANSLWNSHSIEQAKQTSMENQNFSKKVENLPNPHHHHLKEKSMFQSFHNTYETDSITIPCNKKPKFLSYIPILQPNTDRNHCHCFHVCAGESQYKLLQLHDVIPSVSLLSTQRSKCHNHHSQLTWLPQQMSQHRDILFGMFEILPPLYLLKSSKCKTVKPGIKLKNQHQHQNHCQFDYMKHKFQPDAIKTKPKIFSPLQQGEGEHMHLDYGRVVKYLQNKSKPSDRDVMFGNAYHLLSKHYGWGNSRLEWLLKLEQ